MKKKVVHIAIGDPTGGLDIIVKMILEDLGDFENEVIYMHPEGSRVYKDFENHKVFRKVYRGNNIFVNLFGRLKDLKNSDIVHVHNVDAWAIFSPLFLFRKKLVYSLHGNFGSDIKKNILTKIAISSVINYVTLFSRKLIFLTNSQKTHLKKYCFFKKTLERKSVVINNFILNKIILVNKKKFNNKVLFVGRYTPLKGFEDLMDVAKELKDTSFSLIGDNNFKTDLPNVANLGKVDHSKIFKEYDKNSILILPSYTETWGLVILEAMARGLIVLASDLPVIREYFIDSRNGYLFRPGDTKKIKELLSYLKENPEEMQRISRNNLKDIKNFTKDKIIAKYIKLYEKILN